MEYKENKVSKNKIGFILIALVLLILSVIGALKTIYINADIDESYALTLGVRIARNDAMFKDMWEVHQTSAFLYAGFVKLFMLITGGVQGILVYMRYIGVLIQGLIACFIFVTLQKDFGKRVAFLSGVLFFNFTPKHIQSPEFTIVLYWGTMVLLMLLYRYYKEKKVSIAVLASVAYCVCVLAYPVIVILAPLLSVLIYKGARQRKAIIAFLSTAILLGVLFIVYIASQSSFFEMLSNISCVLMDESHNQSYLHVLWEHLKTFFKMSIPIGLVLLVYLVAGISDKVKNHRKPICFFILAVLFFIQFHTINEVNFLEFMPLIWQALVVVCFFFVLEKEENYVLKRSELIRIFVVPTLLFLVCVLVSSNLYADYSMGVLMPSVVLLLPIYTKELLDKCKGQKSVILIKKVAILTCIIAFVILMFTSRIFLVRFTSTQRKNIFEGYYRAYHGPIKGIYVSDNDYRQYEAKIPLFYQLVGTDDIFLYVGCDMFIYSLCENNIGTGNTISTPVFGEQILAYYEKYPEKIPTIFFVDHEYVSDFQTALEQEPFKTFVEQNYLKDESVINTPVSVYRLKE